jgi:hypothetical protein
VAVQPFTSTVLGQSHGSVVLPPTTGATVTSGLTVGDEVVSDAHAATNDNKHGSTREIETLPRIDIFTIGDEAGTWSEVVREWVRGSTKHVGRPARSLRTRANRRSIA